MAEKLEFDLSVKNNQLNKALDSATKKGLNLESTLQTAVGVFAGNLLTKGAEIAVGAIGSLVDITQEAIDAAAGQEVAVNNLNAALARSGNLTQETTADLQAYASQLQATTKFEDDAAIAATALLQSLTKLDKDGLKAGVSAAADLATVLGIDLDSAIRLIAKGAAGQTEAFSRYGIAVQKGTTDTESFNNVIASLNAKFGGAAAAQLNTYSGSVTALKNAYGDLLEPIGDVIVKNPAVIATFNAIKDVINGANTAVAENNGVFKELVQDGIFATIAAAKLLLDGLDGITIVVKALSASIQGIGSIIGLGLIEPFRLAFDAVTLLLSKIPLVGDAFKDLENPLNSIVENLRGNFNQAIQDLSESADDNVFRQLSDGADAFAQKVIDGAENIKLANTDIASSNQTRLDNESLVNEEILRRREQLGIDLFALQAQLAGEQAANDEALRQANLEISGQRDAEDILRAAEIELQKNQAIYEAQLERNALIQDAGERRLANEKALGERQLKDEQVIGKKTIEYKKALAAQEQQIFNSRIAASQAFLNLGIALAREGSFASKALQTANAVISTYTGANQVLGDPAIPVIAKPAFVAATIATGLANVARINGVQFEQGGVVGGVNGGSVGPDNRVAQIRDGEMILNADQQKNLMNMLTNGQTGGDIVVQIDGREVFRAVRDQLKQGMRFA